MFGVVNHLHFDSPVEEFVAALEEEGAPLLATMKGFKHFYFIKEGEDRAAVVIVWDNAEDAANGSKQFGSTWFAQNIAPRLASDQQRIVGPILVQN